MRILDFMTEAQSVKKILTHIYEPIEASVMAPARRPPQEWFCLDQRIDD